MKTKLVAVFLAAILATGCATKTKTVFVKPECEPAPRPVLDLDRAAVWEALGGSMSESGECLNSGCRLYFRVDATVNDAIDWGLENEAVINVVCKG